MKPFLMLLMASLVLSCASMNSVDSERSLKFLDTLERNMGSFEEVSDRELEGFRRAVNVVREAGDAVERIPATAEVLAAVTLLTELHDAILERQVDMAANKRRRYQLLSETLSRMYETAGQK